MELREYYKILRKNISVMVYTILILVVLTYIWSIRKAETYSTSFLISISRVENQSTSDYRYDQYYRIQADDKFSDTVSEWLKSPGVVQEIFEKSGLSANGKSLRQLEKTFRAEKMSPEIIEVRFSPDNPDEGKKIGDAISAVVSEKTKDINSPANDPNWFRADTSNLITVKNFQDLRINLLLAAVAGIFIGALFAFLKHYISEPEN
ncbi:MAG: Wzz/FepE/Etk N-terminal domain-containing protein [Parcubacteria group bacterium]|jgi:capsular polysaccharide biosynthesis protein